MLAFVGVEAIVSVVSRERRSDSGSNGYMLGLSTVVNG